MSESLRDKLMYKVKVLNETAWFGADIGEPKIRDWLDNFKGERFPRDQEQLHALYLLGHFLYFGVPEFRELLRALYRDLYLYPIIQERRTQNGNTTRYEDISALVKNDLESTRFIGMGRASESGAMLLYLFRQVNNIPLSRFLHSHEVFKRYGSGTSVQVRDPNIAHYVFIDDLCGSGTQACEYYRDIVLPLRQQIPSVQTHYLVVFSTAEGIDHVRCNAQFDVVNSVFELDESFKVFSDDSRHFQGCPPSIDKNQALEIFLHYGSQLCARHPLGYKSSQLLLGFWHNTPDNTLPPIWYNEDLSMWRPIFERYHKI